MRSGGYTMQLTYQHITHNIIRCTLPDETTIVRGRHEEILCEHIGGGIAWNMSATIIPRVTLTSRATSAVIEWRDSGPVKTSGDLEIEIAKQ